jgi:hypothetical protein
MHLYTKAENAEGVCGESVLENREKARIMHWSGKPHCCEYHD